MRDHNLHAVPAHSQLCALQNEVEEDRIRFTPVKRVSNTIPRLWDRKPSTSYLARSSRPRKVWKRFRTSFNSMKAFRQIIGVSDQRVEEDELDTEINSSRNAGLLRGVKRRCLKSGWEEKDVDTGAGARGRSFLETKWESEVRRKRKLPTDHDFNITTVDQNDCQETGLQPATSDVEVDTQDSDELAGPGVDTAYPEPLHVTPVQCGKDESDSDMILRKDVDPAVEPTSDAAADEVRDACADATTVDGGQHPEPPEKDTAPAEEIVSAEQESTLVRSALRSSLDGDDAALLNNFLSKAKAKRAAKAAMASQEDAAMKQKAAQEGEVVIPDLPTPQPRRALEELDANSPSPSPQKVTSPRKAEKPAASPIRKDTSRKDGEQAENDQQQPGSPTTRRSTRTRTPRVPPRTTIPAFQNSLSLRRAKGTEFVFLQRTEAQELSLATRKNTKQNKGNSVLPKYTLKALSTKQGSSEASPSPENSIAYKKGGSGKRVCWNDARLVEFEDGEEPQPALSSSQESSDELSDSKTHINSDAQSGKQGSEKRKTSSSRSTRSQATTIAMPPSPAARRVRLGNKSTPSAPETGTSSSSSRDTSTPSNKRKKLTPRSPSNALLETPPSKKSVGVSSSAATITTTTTSSSGTTTATSKSSTTSAGGGTKSKSKSIFKANAGSTPMPKRVRSRA